MSAKKEEKTKKKETKKENNQTTTQCTSYSPIHILPCRTLTWHRGQFGVKYFADRPTIHEWRTFSINEEYNSMTLGVAAIMSK